MARRSDVTRALAETQDGNGRLVLDLGGLNAGIESQYAIECLDWPRSALEASQATNDAVLAASPRLGPLYVEGPSVCGLWPAEPDPPSPLTGAGAGPILVVGNTGDTANRLKSSRDLTEHLEGGLLLIVEANQHGAYSIGPDNLCVMETVDRYLTDLGLPANESRPAAYLATHNSSHPAETQHRTPNRAHERTPRPVGLLVHAEPPQARDFYLHLIPEFSRHPPTASISSCS